MRINKLLLLCFLLFFTLPSFLHAQFISKDIIIGDTTQVHVLNTENGDRYVGRVTKIVNTTVFLLFKDTKELEFTLSEISSLVLFKEQESKGRTSRGPARNADYLRAKAEYEARNTGKNQSAILNGEEHLFFSPTAYTLGKGKNEFRNIMVFYNRIDFGLSDNVDIGFDLMPLIGVNLFATRIKAGVPLSDFINIGFGGSVFFVIQPNNFRRRDVTGTTHTYGTATFGSRDKFINVGYGYAFPFNSEISDGSTLLTFGGALRIGKRWKLMADFVLLGIDDEPDSYSVGASWFDDKNRFDFGINTFAMPDDDFSAPFIPIPFVSYSLTFGKK